MKRSIRELSPEERAELETRLLRGRSTAAKNPSINRRDGMEPPALSFSQQRLWFLDRFLGGSPAYNIVRAVRLKGTLDTEALQRALDGLVARHESLRTSLEVEDDFPVQVIHGALEVPIEVEDFCRGAAAERETAMQARIQSESNRAFDLSHGPLLRVTLLRLGEDEHVLVLVIHHIVSDGWSMGVLQRELSECYEAALERREPQLPELPIQYADYALWQRTWLRGEELQRQVDYWRKQLDGLPPLELPADRPRPAQMSYRGTVKRFAIPAELVARLKSLAREENATLFMVLTATFQTLLMRYSGQEDFAVGIPVAGRNRPELEGLIGFFVNTLVLRGNLGGNPPFRELVGRTRETALEAYAHQDLPFEKLVEALNPARDLSRNPLFQVMFTLQNMPAEALSLPGVEAQRLPLHSGTAKFDLSLALTETGGRLEGVLGYATDLFDAGRIGRMADHFLRLLEGVADTPESPLWRLPLLTEAEYRQLLVEWNATEVDYPKDRCIHQLFEAQAARTPETVAVVCGGHTLTYGELNTRANRLAHHLVGLGVGPDTLVGVCLERSLGMVVAVLGILKAGGAYLPLDPEYPAERLAFMLTDTQAPVVLTQQGLRGHLPDAGTVHICLDADSDAWAQQPDTNPASQVKPRHLAYVIYTSGSTGQPKGVMVPQHAVIRLVRNAGYMTFSSKTVIAQLANASFDAATFEIWGPLLNGGRVVIVGREASLAPHALAQHLKEQEVSTLFLTTALFNEILRALPNAFESLDTLLFGGEACDPNIVRRCLDHPPRRLVHVYGPTESTTFATFHEVRKVPESASTVPIGRPISNTRCYVLDRFQNPVPAGVPGELYLGGDGLARGYLNRPELTADRFVANPFSDDPSARWYRTGDQVRYLADGNIEFLGRLDHQVKVRGYRIELGEIETVLNQHPDIARSLVLLREDRPGDKRLTAYVVGRESIPPAVNLRAHLEERLPDYMLPSAYVPMEALPLTPNGKVDRAALPVPEPEDRPQGHVPPRSPLEENLAYLWAEVLGIDRVGIRDNFFDLGGHSLLAVQLMSSIEQRLGTSLHLNTLWFGAGTIESQAQVLASEKSNKQSARVVMMRSGGKRTPLFCIHTIGGGNLFHYSSLVEHLDSDRPVYGLQARGIDGAEPPDCSVEAMATYCINSLKTVWQGTPYFLCGFSSGGVVAFEMARQLEKKGRFPVKLVLVDTYSPRHPRCFTELLSIWLGMLRRKQYRAIQERLYHALLAPFELQSLRRLRALGESHRWALWDYNPKPYGGDLAYFEAKEGSSTRMPPHAGWRDHVKGEITLVKVPGMHSQMLHKQHVAELAQRLNAFLDGV